ncbi:hypothetical protein [Methanolobus profundi]|uniref:Uncharacterized protein n=1 Tax=Methanolobus profundi TaxID=487685 RepID=A0A1I4PWD6_9EURY|nr:hypothetical protein [Methanolobus profundi]SFM31763.1 hypothetical protein SAMN04488696_0925 [Methanolobus profundi]
MEKNVPIKPGASKKDNMIKDLIIVGVVLFAGVMLVNTLEDLDDSSIYEFLRIRFDLTGSQEGISETEHIIYPSEAPDDICLDSKRTVYPSTGEGSATWFYYGNCGGWKIYDVVPGSAVKLQARGDECSTCPSCTLGDINYYIYDYYDDQWNEMEFIDGPDNHCGEYIEYYIPTGDRIKIVAESGFYLTVYQ